MNFEDMQRLWREQGEELERARPVDLLPTCKLDGSSSKPFLKRYALGRWIELGIGTVALVVILTATVRRIEDTRFVVMASSFWVYIAAMMASSLYQLVETERLDTTQSLVELQRRVRHLQVTEYRSMKWAILIGVWMWVPGMLVLLRIGLGVDLLERVSVSWILSQLALGLVLSIVGQRLSVRYVEREDAGATASRFLSFIAGTHLDSALRELEELTAFEQDA